MSLIWSPDYAPVDGDFADVSLLLLGEGTNGSTTILDSSSNNLSVTAVGNAQISTAQNTPFGPTVPSDGVLSFPNLSGDYIETANNAAFQFGSGDFTFEYWIYPTSLGGTKQHVNTAAAGGNYSYAIITESIPGGRGRLRYYLSSTGNSFDIVSGNIFGEIDLNTWNHIALARSGNTITAYLNGVPGNSVTSTAALFNFTTPFYLGTDAARLFFAPGYFSNLRITKGVARYTENFDVPTAPFPILSPSGRITIADDSLDADARQYIINVEEQDGEELEAGVRTAINNFVVGCKSDGIWNAIKASCLLCGARTLEGALVPLKGGAPTNFNFTSSDYDRELGLVGDGSTKYLDSNRANNADPDANNHNAIYMTTGGNGGKMGASNNKIRNSSFGNRTTTYFTGFGSPSLASVNNSLVGHTRISSSEYTYYIGDTPRTGVVPQAGQSASSDNVFIFDDGFGSRTSSRFAFYSIGENLDLALLDTRISNFITAIGAAI